MPSFALTCAGVYTQFSISTMSQEFIGLAPYLHANPSQCYTILELMYMNIGLRMYMTMLV